ncbi:4-sulfomuconolactone hydrolase [Variibacter gotjawalensis]|uniref:4-sulfomuconolactone hydrolase n=1 Tax=Variibacter gotjawalensis TaxID=1333996 RepID=A0A0S3PRE4_9BRAD|nr:amidohydrolase family protein [Variibacter gotjawalensis]NIK48753.1 D-galactarolactone isomerase [Variibacter gotjawalensis]RZS50614.1 D-galactarolactone isomerase [Variibacter gotjawalensis]BAT58448.1 4-sulfomuconolactone hydrolase [Variibacter gotjawalensis]
MTERRFETPAGLCDTHMHFYLPEFPAVAGAHVPSRGAVEDYAALRTRLGIDRVVVVQPTGYGFDNRCTLAGMASLGRDVARGVAVVRDDIADSELKSLHAAGIHGLRLAMIKGGAIGWQEADAIVRRVQSVGWHTQLQLDGSQLPTHESQILGWPGEIVVDHIGRFEGGVTKDHPAVRALLRLLDTGRVWLKLSAPYWGSRSGPPRYDDMADLVHLFVAAAPDRMVWATNWPHPSLATLPDDMMLLNCLADWVPDEAIRRRVLVDNPARLYGFPS